MRWAACDDHRDERAVGIPAARLLGSAACASPQHRWRMRSNPSGPARDDPPGPGTFSRAGTSLKPTALGAMALPLYPDEGTWPHATSVSLRLPTRVALARTDPPSPCRRSALAPGSRRHHRSERGTSPARGDYARPQRATDRDATTHVSRAQPDAHDPFHRVMRCENIDAARALPTASWLLDERTTGCAIEAGSRAMSVTRTRLGTPRLSRRHCRRG
jgi:hypothetical protein